MPAPCASICITGNRCELAAGHRGQCRFTYLTGQQEWWVRRDENARPKARAKVEA